MNRRWAWILVTALMAGCGDKDDQSKREKKRGSSSAPSGQAAAPGSSAEGPGEHSAAERKILVKLARQTLTAVVNGEDIPKVDVGELPAKLKADKGCFVTLNKSGQLRGCIGYIFPRGPLYKAVMENARNAALYDRRFPRVAPAELRDIEIEISILTVPKPLAFTSLDDLLARLRPNIDGVVFEAKSPQRTYGSVYLPQVWEKIPDRKEFMTQLSRKAGLSLPDWAWRPDRVKIQTYQAEVFHEWRR